MRASEAVRPRSSSDPAAAAAAADDDDVDDDDDGGKQDAMDNSFSRSTTGKNRQFNNGIIRA